MTTLIRATLMCALLAASVAAQTPPPYELEIYEAQDLVRRIAERDPDDPSVEGILDPDELLAIVTDAVGADAWGEPASIELHRGRLIVNQTREVHRQLRDVLTNLRRTADVFVQVEMRVFAMPDPFLRNIGVSSNDAHDEQRGPALKATILERFQLRAIIDHEQEHGRRKVVQAPVVTVVDRQWVHVSIVTQRAYVSDYELSAGGGGPTIADPVVSTFEEGVVLDVRPTISADRKSVTLDVRSTVSTLVSLQEVTVDLGSIPSAAIQVTIEVPELRRQKALTSVTLPDGGTVLFSGLRPPAPGTPNEIILMTAKLIPRQAD